MNKKFKIGSSMSLFLASLSIGVFSGGLAVFYRFLLSKLEVVRNTIYSNNSFPRAILIIAISFVLGICVSKLLKWAPLSGGSGIPQVQGELIGAFNQNSFRVTISKIVGGAIASLVGLSLGREGPSIQLGASSAKWLSEKFGKSKTEEKLYLTAGAAAGLSAAFSAPISGLVFILEELHKSFSKKVVAISFSAAVIADVIAVWVFKIKPVFSFGMTHVLPTKYYLLIFPMIIICSVVGKLFNSSITFFQDVFAKIKLEQDIKIAIFFAFVSVVGLFYKDILGGGHSFIENMATHNYNSFFVLIILLLFKMFMTSTSYATGTQGGIFLPVLVLGGITGLFYFNLMSAFGFVQDVYLSNFVVLAMVCVLTAVVRSPLLSVVLVLELNGNMTHLLGLAFCSIMAYFICMALDFEPIYDILLKRMLNKRVEGNGVNDEFTMFDIKLGYNNGVSNKKIKDIDFPKDALIAEVDSNGEKYVPNGDSVLKTGDIVTVLVKDEQLYDTRMKVLEVFGENNG
ncbi:ClC family H(+)/Cl(-) exchange transporter [Finegoldia magna]|uniref:ClC family H(+)/Cl(-) exchange transporter n=1 Tax=Finegoldia magna TaxID=1260 RepID=UPI0007963F5D|nr:ClC family H(+)/Cl(-) exchange transporter [Finegoldia magna]KXA10786.1 chloride transporter, ClC family [Finegoldia magna]